MTSFVASLRAHVTGLTGGVVPLRERLRAWWDGYRLVIPEREAAAERSDAPTSALARGAAEQASEKVLRDPRIPKSWTPTRIEAAQMIWGKGFVTPGGESYVTEFVTPLGLVPAITLLDLNAGVGGTIRTAHVAFGAWAEGYDIAPELANVGTHLSKMAGLSSKAPVRHYDPAGDDFPKGPYDCVIAREFFYTIPDKVGLLSRIERALKKRGQFLFTDFVWREKGLSSPSIAAWQSTEATPSTPWTKAEYAAQFERLQLECRIIGDVTDQYRKLIHDGWQNLMPNLEVADATPVDVMRAVLDEVGLWARRSMALKGGDIQLLRFHLLKRA